MPGTFARHCDRDGLVITTDLSGIDCGHAGDGWRFTVCGPITGLFWRAESGDVRHATDIDKLPDNGSITRFSGLVLRVAAGGSRYASVFVRRVVRIPCESLRAKCATDDLSRHSGWRTRFCNFWPLGAALLTIMSWREALLMYALSGY